MILTVNNCKDGPLDVLKRTYGNRLTPIGSMGDHDDRWKIYSACLDMRNLVDLDRIGNKPTIEYNGIIPIHEFATELLINLMSALNNESICHGLDRFQDHTQNGYFKAFSNAGE